MAEFLTIKVFNYPTDYYMAKTFLESAEIVCFGKDENINVVNPFITNAVGGIKLQVPSDQVDEAIQLLIEGGFAKPEDFDTPEDLRKVGSFIDRIKGIFKRESD